MNEREILKNTLKILNDSGEKEAYVYVFNATRTLDKPSSHTYNFLYCLASLSGKTDEALSWMEGAVLENKYWYRPEVFDDSDLDNIRESKRFNDCVKASKKLYLDEMKDASTVCTWDSVNGSDIFLVLHGNQESIPIVREHWDFLKNHGKQVEYIQSRELDSFNIFRWNDDGTGPEQLRDCILEIEWESYKTRVLCGFSAGCNVILSAIEKGYVKADLLILQSPWIPVVKNSSDSIIESLINNSTKILFICGKDDKDCIPFMKFAQKAKSNCIDITEHYIDALAHDYPKDFEKLVLEYLGDS